MEPFQIIQMTFHRNKHQLTNTCPSIYMMIHFKMQLQGKAEPIGVSQQSPGKYAVQPIGAELYSLPRKEPSTYSHQIKKIRNVCVSWYLQNSFEPLCKIWRMTVALTIAASAVHAAMGLVHCKFLFSSSQSVTFIFQMLYLTAHTTGVSIMCPCHLSSSHLVETCVQCV